MIELPLTTAPAHRVAILGLGRAGGNMLDRLVLNGTSGATLLAVNTDAQALSGSVAPCKVQIGTDRTRGLGTGSDPEIGAEAAHESLGEIMAQLGEASLVLILTGLGGGTGSGALPVLAEAIRARDARVIVLATLPFAFEGKRRRQQALDSLSAIEDLADLLLCFENDRMSEIASARAGIQEAFTLVDQTLAEAVRTLSAVLTQRGLLHAGLDEIRAAFEGQHLRALFGWGEATGDNRACEAIEAALKCPLLDRGRQLREAASVVVHLTGSADLTLHEAQTALEEVRRHFSAETAVHCGLAVDEAASPYLRVTILASTTAGLQPAAALAAPASTAAPAPRALSPQPTRPVAPPPLAIHAPVAAEPLELSVELPATLPEPVADSEAEPAAAELFAQEPAESELEISVPEMAAESEAEIEAELEEEFDEEPEAEEVVDAELESEPEDEEESAAEAATAEAGAEPVPEPATRPLRPRMRPLFAPGADNLRRPNESAPQLPGRKPREERQEQMQFESAQRGRFEKSEPTIVDGQNLDIPTFMRRNLKPNR